MKIDLSKPQSLRCLCQIGMVLIVTLLITGRVHAQELEEGQFREIAVELLEGMKDAKFGQISSSAGYNGPKVALRALNTQVSVLSEEEGAEINRYLLSNLQKNAGSDFYFIDRANLETLLEDADAFGQESNKLNYAETLRENNYADILLIGTLRSSQKALYLSYQAVASDTGQVLVSTMPRRLIYREEVMPFKAGSSYASGVETNVATTSTYLANVEQAEIRLSELGFFPGQIDGYLTDETRSALRAYQSHSALPISGRLTRQTFRNMFLDTRSLN